MFYSSSTNGFYDPEINATIPKDAVEISLDTWRSLMEAQSAGKVIQADAKGKPVAVDRPALTNEQVIALYEKAAQSNLDKIAQDWGYSSLMMAASYASSTNAQYKADAETLIAWRDALWDKVYTIEAGKLPKTVDAFLALLPVAPTKPTL